MLALHISCFFCQNCEFMRQKCGIFEKVPPQLHNADFHWLCVKLCDPTIVFFWRDWCTYALVAKVISRHTFYSSCCNMTSIRPRRCLTSPPIWSLYTQTIRCWEWGSCPAPGSTRKLAYHSEQKMRDWAHEKSDCIRPVVTTNLGWGWIVSLWDEGRKQRNESTTYHVAILGNIGVRTSCVMKNQTMPIVLPAMPP